MINPFRCVVMLATAAAIAAVPATASAVPTSAGTPSSGTYVALGSSFASGYGQMPYVDTEIGTVCGRSLEDYPEQVAATLGLNLVDVTCGGATTANILSTPQYGFIPPQIDAVTADTSVVTITVGGNDVNYLLDLDRNSCADDPAVVPPLYQPDICTPVDPAATKAALAQLEQNLVEVVQAVQQRAPSARIVLVDYLTILPLTNTGCAALPLTAPQIAYSRNVATQLAVDTAEAAFQTRAADLPMSLLSLGHNVCSPEPWVNPWSSSVAPAWYHPNADGIAFEAKVISAFLRVTGRFADDR